MEKTPTNDLLIPSDNTDDLAPEPTLPPPHFDETSIQQARPAVPLAQVKARRFWPLAVVLMCGASLLGGVLGVALSRYESRSVRVATPVAGTAPEGTAQNESSASVSRSVAEPDEKTNDAGPSASEGNVEATRAARSRENSSVGSESMSNTQDGEAHAKLQGALDEWIAATNARDIQRQMGFYNQKVNAFYLTRNVPREAVLAEKSRVFGRANVIDIRAATPGIRVSRDGRTATMRFRKKYAIEGGGEDRHGEVLQELRWQRTDDGWKIVSERDLRVIN